MNKTIKSAFAGILAVAILGGATLGGMQLWADDSLKPSNWFGAGGSPDTGELNVDLLAGNMAVNGGESNGVSFMAAKIPVEQFEHYGISTQAESAVQIKATLTPVSADDKRVEWTVAPVSGDTNAADYITLTIIGNTATVACLQDFDVQFIVTAKSVDNPEAYATCTLDYVQRVTGVTVNMPKLTSTTAAVTYDIEGSKYTIKSDFNVTFGNFVFNGAFKDEYCDANGFDEIQDFFYWFHQPNTNAQLVNYTSNGLEFVNAKSIVKSIANINGRTDCIDGLIGCIFSYNGEIVCDSYCYDEGELGAQFRYVCSEYYLGTVDITVTSSRGGNTYNTLKKSIEIWADGDSLHIPVTGLSLDKDSIIF